MSAQAGEEDRVTEALLQVKIDAFCQQERASSDTIDVKKIYIDMADGDLVAGVLLSQIVYWHLPDKKTGKSKLRVKKYGQLWIAKTRAEWYEECRISEKQVDRALDILRDGGLIETKIIKFNGAPTTHIRLYWENFIAIYTEALNGYSPKGKFNIAQRVNSLTETTTETTLLTVQTEAVCTATGESTTTTPEVYGHTKENPPEGTDKRLNEQSESLGKETNGSVAPQKVKPPNQAYVIGQVLGEVAHIDTAANIGRLCREAKLLCRSTNPTPTAELIQRHYGAGGWWYKEDWRGRGGNGRGPRAPNPSEVRETWGQWQVKEPEGKRLEMINGKQMEVEYIDGKRVILIGPRGGVS